MGNGIDPGLAAYYGWTAIGALGTGWFATCAISAYGLSEVSRQQCDQLVRNVPPRVAQLYFQHWSGLQLGEEEARTELRARFGRATMRWSTWSLFVLVTFAAFTMLGIWSWRKTHGTEEAEWWWVVVGSVCGGLAWVAVDQVERVRRRDFAASDVASHVVRLLVAVPFGVCVANLPGGNAAVAFAIGAFPTDALFRYARRIADRHLSLGDTTGEHSLELQKLQGVERPEAERFAAEGIRSILQLAYTDPIALTFRTNFDFDFVTDLVGQALLWTYTTTRLSRVQALGIRGCVEAKNLLERLEGREGANAHAKAVLADVAAKAELSPEVVRNLLEELCSDPYAQFISQQWRVRVDLYDALARVEPAPALEAA